MQPFSNMESGLGLLRKRWLALAFVGCQAPVLWAQQGQQRAAMLDHLTQGEVVVTGDFNKDGKEDAILAVPTEGMTADLAKALGEVALYIFWGTDSRQAEVTALDAPRSEDARAEARAWKLLVQDEDGDGIDDLWVSVQENTPSGVVDSLWIYKGGPRAIAAPLQASRTDMKRFQKAFPLAREASPRSADARVLSRVARTLEREPCPVVPFRPWSEMNALQRHLSFFDSEGDGKVTLQENFRGLRDLGIPSLLALPFAIAINGAMATPTAGYPSFTLKLAHIDAGMHGSDSGLYDDEGRFDSDRFERWFSTWDKNGDGALDLKELAQRLFKETDLFDLFGSVASGGEFGALFLVAAEQGKISKERMRELYEGELFYAVAAARGTLGCRQNFAEHS